MGSFITRVLFIGFRGEDAKGTLDSKYQTNENKNKSIDVSNILLLTNKVNIGSHTFE